MRRREFIRLIGGVAAWPVAARAQQQASMPVIGFLSHESPSGFADDLRAFHRGLSEVGYMEGRNVAIEYRWAENQNNRLPALADDLVRRKVNVIAVPRSTPGVLAAKGATTTIPIVFSTAINPVEMGLVASLNRPGGNLTGMTTLNLELEPKRLELLHELVPTATTIALLLDPTNSNSAIVLNDMQAAARTLRLQLHVIHASNQRDFSAAFESLADQHVGGLVIAPDPFFGAQLENLAGLALRRAVPAIYNDRMFPAAGGLLSYAASLKDSSRMVGVYCGRILNGEKPADLPVVQPTKFELVINLKTAKVFGLTVPQTLLLAADEVLE